MRYLVYGGSGSGKSTFAENIVSKLDTKTKIYLATMQVYDEEGLKKVKRHQELRKDKGFLTVEAPNDFSKHKELTGSFIENSTVLLECMSNLVANEMFRDDTIVSKDEVIDKVTKEILKLFNKFENVVLVSNNIFEDGIEYDNTTLDYMEALAAINTNVSAYCDEVWEIVAGIPLKYK